jgi:hypothetical protein
MLSQGAKLRILNSRLASYSEIPEFNSLSILVKLQFVNRKLTFSALHKKNLGKVDR